MGSSPFSAVREDLHLLPHRLVVGHEKRAQVALPPAVDHVAGAGARFHRGAQPLEGPGRTSPVELEEGEDQMSVPRRRAVGVAERLLQRLSRPRPVAALASLPAGLGEQARPEGVGDLSLRRLLEDLRRVEGTVFLRRGLRLPELRRERAPEEAELAVDVEVGPGFFRRSRFGLVSRSFFVSRMTTASEPA
jgi:hypothetical protein